MNDDSSSRLSWARSVAAEVGDLLLTSFRKKVGFQRKDKGIVTELDVQAEQIIKSSLAEAFPGDGLVSEEGASKESQSGLRWIVDPLDGTTNFVSGLPFFGTSIACVDDDGPLLGVVHAPELRETYWAVRGGGAFGADGPLGPAPELALKDSVFILNKAYHPATQLWDAAKNLLPSIRAFRLYGCVSLDLAYVAAGHADGIVLLESDPWDVAAGVVLLGEAGIPFTDLAGQEPPTDRKTGIFAAAPSIFEEAIAGVKAPAV